MAKIASMCSQHECKKPHSRGGLCQMHHWRLRTHGDASYKPWPDVRCSIEGCHKKHKGHGLCQLHLSRKKKGLPMSGVLRTKNPKRYQYVKLPNHPLAMKNGCVFVHRKVLYDQIGEARVPCFWCGNPLEWRINLHVDHRDHDRQNNDPKNLLPSCNSCNAGRMLFCSKNRVSIYSSVVGS